jgi:hypothetical protein
MLVPRCHPQVFVSSQLRYGVNIRALHSQPARRRVAEVAETEVGNTQLLHARANAMLTCSPVKSWKNISFERTSGVRGGMTAFAVSFRYTIRPSPFLVCGSMTRPCARSTSNQHSPNSSDRRIPLQAANARTGRNHSEEASRTARSSPGCR